MVTKVKSLFKRKIIAILVVVAVFAISVFGTASPVKADVLQGVGTESDPFIITTAKMLASIPFTGMDKHYKLGNDIDLSTYGEWTPIKFQGNFNGNGHKITGLKIVLSKGANTYYVGLFGTIGGATILNLSVSAEISSNGENIGCLGGSASNSTFINCYSIAKINGAGKNVGGLLGSAGNCSIIDCHSSGTVAGVSNIGGLLGCSNKDNIITDCNFSGTVAGTSEIGGLIGQMRDGNLDYSYSTGSVIGTGNNCGGIVGFYERQYGCIGNCYSSSSVKGDTNVGGFAGFNKFNNSGIISDFIWNCYATGNVEGRTYVGGFAGQSFEYNYNNLKIVPQIINCYSSGKIIGASVAGGFSGFQQKDANILKSYWCSTNSPSTSYGVASNSGECDLTSMTNTAMQQQSFADTLNNNIYSLNLPNCAKWKIDPTKNNGYPILDGVGDGDTADTVAPSGLYTLSPTTSTNGEVTINVTATDDNSGVKSIKCNKNNLFCYYKRNI